MAPWLLFLSSPARAWETEDKEFCGMNLDFAHQLGSQVLPHASARQLRLGGQPARLDSRNSLLPFYSGDGAGSPTLSTAQPEALPKTHAFSPSGLARRQCLAGCSPARCSPSSPFLPHPRPAPDWSNPGRMLPGQSGNLPERVSRQERQGGAGGG